MIRTEHIQKMLAEALRLSQVATEYPHNGHPVLDGVDHLIWDNDRAWPVSQLLERAINLAEHAAHELRDEQLRQLHRFPVV